MLFSDIVAVYIPFHFSSRTFIYQRYGTPFDRSRTLVYDKVAQKQLTAYPALPEILKLEGPKSLLVSTHTSHHYVAGSIHLSCCKGTRTNIIVFHKYSYHSERENCQETLVFSVVGEALLRVLLPWLTEHITNIFLHFFPDSRCGFTRIVALYI